MKRFCVFTAALVCAAALLAGCAKKEAASAAKDTDADTLTIAMSADVSSLNPYAVNDVYSSTVQCQIYDRLIYIDESGAVQMQLAESYEQLDAVRYKFVLHKGVKFHNGDELKANDVVFSLGTAAKTPIISHMFGMIDTEGFETPDDYTVIVRLKAPFTPFLPSLAHTGGGVLNEKLYLEKGKDEYFKHPIGTGPYEFVSWSKNDSVVLKRFDGYWGEKAKIANLVVRIVVESNNRAIEIESGNVDLALLIAPGDISRLAGAPDVQLFRVTEFSTTFAALNCLKPPFTDKRVRQAIAMGVDTAAIVQAVMRGVGKPAVGPVPPNAKYFDTALTPKAREPEKAKALLAAAGFANGLKLTVAVSDNRQRIDMLTIAQDQLKEIGVDLQISVMEWAAFLDYLKAGEHDMACLGWNGQSTDPDGALYSPFTGTTIDQGGSNYARFTTPRLQQLLDGGRVMPDSPEREKTYLEIQRLIVEETPWIFLFNQEQVIAAKKSIKGFTPNPAGFQQNLARVSKS